MTAQDNRNSDLNGGSQERTRQPVQVNKMQVRAMALTSLVTNGILSHHVLQIYSESSLLTHRPNVTLPRFVFKSDHKVKMEVHVSRSASAASGPGAVSWQDSGDRWQGSGECNHVQAEHLP